MFYLAPGYALGSLYSNTILANLNARTYLWSEETTDVDVDPFTVTLEYENTKTNQQPENPTSGEATLVSS